MTAAEREVFTTHTGRTAPPDVPAREAWVAAGRRSGKSRIAALVATYCACFTDHRPHLAAGEVGTLPVIAADRQQARNVFRYIRGLLATPMLRQLVVNETRESVELSTRVVIEVHTASFRAVRGLTLVGAILDEVSFWNADEAGANPDVEVLHALRPGLATVPGAVLLGISSPYARRGVLWQAYRKHFAQDGAVLVWRGDSATMNPTLDPQRIAEAYQDDPGAAASEWGGEFRSDLSTFLDAALLDACLMPDRAELPPLDSVTYHAFVDPSGGSGADSMTLGIAHTEGDRVLLDVVAEVRPPFSPEEAVRQFAALCAHYRVGRVVGDRFGGSWPAERFGVHGLTYLPAEWPKSQIYLEVLPLFSGRRVELLDVPRLTGQLAGLERRTGRGSGRDLVDHEPCRHDDLANAACGALLLAARAAQVPVVAPVDLPRMSYWRRVGT